LLRNRHDEANSRFTIFCESASDSVDMTAGPHRAFNPLISKNVAAPLRGINRHRQTRQPESGETKYCTIRGKWNLNTEVSRSLYTVETGALRKVDQIYQESF
jgi:hypothetical protein